jgi:hypothetical protein
MVEMTSRYSLSLRWVASSSSPVRREYPATSAYSIAASLRGSRSEFSTDLILRSPGWQDQREFYSSIGGNSRLAGLQSALSTRPALRSPSRARLSSKTRTPAFTGSSTMARCRSRSWFVTSFRRRHRRPRGQGDGDSGGGGNGCPPNPRTRPRARSPSPPSGSPRARPCRACPGA